MNNRENGPGDLYTQARGYQTGCGKTCVLSTSSPVLYCVVRLQTTSFTWQCCHNTYRVSNRFFVSIWQIFFEKGRKKGKERREVIRVRWGHEEQTNGILALIRRDIQEPLHPHLLFLSVLWGHSREKVAVCKLGKNLSPEPKHAGTPILKFQPLGLWEK